MRTVETAMVRSVAILVDIALGEPRSARRSMSRQRPGLDAALSARAPTRGSSYITKPATGVAAQARDAGLQQPRDRRAQPGA